VRALRDWLGTRLLRWGIAIITPERFGELLDLIREENARLRRLTEAARRR